MTSRRLLENDAPRMVTPRELAHFRAFGFVVLRGALDPAPLADEIDESLRDSRLASSSVIVGSAGIAFQYVPMMCERTPASLALLDRFAAPAAALLGATVLPVQAKGVRYFGAADWHTDSALDVRSVGFVSYLEPLDAETGALRVFPGSHLRGFGAALAEYVAARAPDAPGWAAEEPGVALRTDPGDVIALDEHLYHASVGGRDRRQWRVDYVEDPIGAEAEAKVRAYFAGLYPPDWDGGYDVDRYPHYGAHWLASGRPSVDRLRELGVYAAAAAKEGFARAKRRESPA